MYCPFCRANIREDSAFCRDCKHAGHCRGDAHHSWDYDTNRPLVCFRGVLFDRRKNDV